VDAKRRSGNGDASGRRCVGFSSLFGSSPAAGGGVQQGRGRWRCGRCPGAYSRRGEPAPTATQQNARSMPGSVTLSRRRSMARRFEVDDSARAAGRNDGRNTLPPPRMRETASAVVPKLVPGRVNLSATRWRSKPFPLVVRCGATRVTQLLCCWRRRAGHSQTWKRRGGIVENQPKRNSCCWGEYRHEKRRWCNREGRRANHARRPRGEQATVEKETRWRRAPRTHTHRFRFRCHKR